MEQDVEIVGVPDRTQDVAALGGVTGITEFEELRYTGREWGFERLHTGDEIVLREEDVIEILAFNGIRHGQERWSIMRVRAGTQSRLTGPLSWRRVADADRWAPAPVEAAIFTNWIKVGCAALIVAGMTYTIFAWLLEGILSGALVTTLSSAAVSVLVIVGASIYLVRSWRQVELARKIARIQADGSMFVVGQPEGY
ncbi:hypothetical protein ROJ8625_03313 [Roseivivax jejudonensis]|uniref:Uncharacterized protein n=1 Tax=Roseivivax jejudonensis TaxID=1529041 RepID=A0A1X6ZYG7_9RHOB|nr:hypothetical protein [Roseivivax jejudonensis]SLN65059.1 hypothetical protein ROJ8625_03313 [Roseivivax jejudonensis]